MQMLGFGFLHKRMNKIHWVGCYWSYWSRFASTASKNTRYRGIYYFTLLITTLHINALKYSLKFVLKSRRFSTSFFLIRRREILNNRLLLIIYTVWLFRKYLSLLFDCICLQKQRKKVSVNSSSVSLCTPRSHKNRTSKC